MAAGDIQAQLLANNPFFSGIAEDPWENTAPDVPSLNKEAYENICALVSAKSEQPKVKVAGLVVGEAGMGKTHLLKRLLIYIRENNIRTTFASVKPFEDPDASMRYLLREIVVSLTKIERDGDATGKDRRKQFEYLVSQLMHRYRQKSGDSGFNLDRSVIPFFQECLPEIDFQVLRALSHYRNDHDPMVRPLVLHWLRGEIIDDEAAGKLGFRDRVNMSEPALEAEAREIILSLGHLLEFCGMSMVVCFDQLDGMRDREVIQAFGKMVHFLVNEVPAMLPLAFIRVDTWDNRFAVNFDQAVQQRFNKRFVLKGCSVDQARELIRLRVEAMFREGAGEKYRWLLERLHLKPGDSPREIIELANRAIVYPGGIVPTGNVPSASETFAHEYRQARDEVAADFEMWPPDAGRLKRALEAWLKSRSEFTDLKRDRDKYIALTGKCTDSGQSADCAFVINTAGHNKTAEAAFKRGVEFLRKRGGRCWYITDKRCNFPGPDRWKVVHQIREEFESLGGRVLILDRQKAVEWYGLTSLIFKLENGDVSLPDSAAVLRPADGKDFDAFMAEGFETDLLAFSVAPPEAVFPPEKQDVEKKEVETPPDEAVLEEKTVNLLKKSPMRLEKATLLLGELTKQGESLSYELFLEFVNKRRELFVLHPSKDGSLVQLLR